jgi:hypothetical protein
VAIDLPRAIGTRRCARHARWITPGRGPIDAFAVVVDECLAQITHNAIGLIDGDPGRRVEHVHQLRVGIRRLRSALRSFRGWVPSPPEPLERGLRDLFLQMGMSRDSDVLASGVVADLARAGGPAMALSAVPAGPDPGEAVRSADTQRMLLAWIAWRSALAQAPLDSPDTPEAKPTTARFARRVWRSGGCTSVESEPVRRGRSRRQSRPEPPDDARTFHRR